MLGQMNHSDAFIRYRKWGVEEMGGVHINFCRI